MRQTAKSKYFVIPALLSLMAVITLVPAQAEDSEQGNSNDGNARSQIVPNSSEDRNALGDSHQDVSVCNSAGPGEASCVAVRRDYYLKGVKLNFDSRGGQSSPNAVAPRVSAPPFISADLRAAYGITGTGSPSKLIALVDYSYYPNALSDLNNYRARYGTAGNTRPMPSCPAPIAGRLTLSSTGTTGCFAQLSQNGTTATTAIPQDSGWSQEEALDIEMATAICPSCSIVLIAAKTANFSDLNTAVGAAKNAGAIAISNSYGGGDFLESGLGSPDNYQLAAAAGIAVTASSGDSGYEVESPASFTNVIGVGGTSLYTNSTSGAWASESTWNGAGSGCSIYNIAPSYQSSPDTASASCAGKKLVSDVSAVTDPATGVMVVWNGGSYKFGGTSVAAPIIASIFGANSYTPTPGTYAGAKIWSGKSNLHDISTGSNRSSSTPAISKIVRNSDGTLTLTFSTLQSSAIGWMSDIVSISGASPAGFNATGPVTAVGYTLISRTYYVASITVKPNTAVSAGTVTLNSAKVSQIASVLNTSATGWDGPTGLGTPITAAAFQ
jgi:hypothetical protein